MTDPIEEAAEALARGQLVIFPTDTVYGLAARPDDPAATERLFTAKGRSYDLPIPVLAGSLAAAHHVGEFDERAELLAQAWPGPITLVLPRAAESYGWKIGGDGRTVGVRVPKHPLALALLALSGPLAVTSANRSGKPPLEDAEALTAEFDDDVAVYLCQDARPAGVASTVVDLTRVEPLILRVGAVSDADVARFLAGEGPLLDSRPSP